MVLFAQVEEDFDIPPLDFGQFFSEHWWEFVLIFIFLVYVYNTVFRPRKLPILKDALIYVLMLLGAFLLLTLQIDANLPIWQTLAVATAVILFLRVRYRLLSRGKKEDSKEGNRNGGEERKGGKAGKRA